MNSAGLEKEDHSYKRIQEEPLVVEYNDKKFKLEKSYAERNYPYLRLACEDYRKNKVLCPSRIKIIIDEEAKLSLICELLSDHNDNCRLHKKDSSTEKVDTGNKTEMSKDQIVTTKTSSEVRKKMMLMLQEKPWLSAKRIFDRQDDSVLLSQRLSIEQIKNVIKYFRRINNMNNDNYCQTVPFNRDGLPFYRGHSSFLYTDKKKEQFFISYLFWCSFFQLSRLRQSDHAFIDCTFCIVPKGYKQLLIVSILDPISKNFFPCVFALLSHKFEILYQELFRQISQLITVNETVDSKLTHITLDFERALHNGVKKQMPYVKIIGCLYYFKARLWDRAKANRLTTKSMRKRQRN